MSRLYEQLADQVNMLEISSTQNGGAGCLGIALSSLITSGSQTNWGPPSM